MAYSKQVKGPRDGKMDEFNELKAIVEQIQRRPLYDQIKFMHALEAATAQVTISIIIERGVAIKAASKSANQSTR